MSSVGCGEFRQACFTRQGRTNRTCGCTKRPCVPYLGLVYANMGLMYPNLGLMSEFLAPAVLLCTFSSKSDGLAEVPLRKLQPNAGFSGVTTTKPRKYAVQLRCHLHFSYILRPAAAKNTSVFLGRAVQIALLQ